MSLLPAHCRSGIERDDAQSTASCAVVFDKFGDSKLHLANMDIHQTINSEMVSTLLLDNVIHGRAIHITITNRFQVVKYENLIASAPIVLFDGNISVDTMGTILEICRKHRKPGK